MTRSNQRTAYGEALVELGAENPNVVVLDADLSKSTMTTLFEKAYPERFFDMGIAEANMISTAAGLAASGKIAFCSTFAVFASGRSYDQIRQTVGIGRLNVKICGSSSGLSDFGDGSTHQSVEDIALMTAIPGMTVLTPCDANEVKEAVRAAARIEGPVYIRVSRNDVCDFTERDGEFVPGALKTLYKSAEKCDVAILTYGVMAEASVTAAQTLEKAGIPTEVVNISTMKPFNYVEVAKLSDKVRAVITAEDHIYIGGLASATAVALGKSQTPMDFVAIEDEYGQSAHSMSELMEHYGLTANAIVAKAKLLLEGSKA